MPEAKYYIDTCVWLNLFKREIGHGDAPDWQLARNCIDWVVGNDRTIILSTTVLLELIESLGRELPDHMQKLIDEKRVLFVQVTSKDRFEAEAIGRVSAVSPADCLHLAICKRLGAVLVTRDKRLIRASSGIAACMLPEDVTDDAVGFP